MQYAFWMLVSVLGMVFGMLYLASAPLPGSNRWMDAGTGAVVALNGAVFVANLVGWIVGEDEDED